MQVLIHAHTDGTIAGVWLEGTPPVSAYIPGQVDFAERGRWMLGNYEQMPWAERIRYIAGRSPYVEQWATVALPDALTPAAALREVLDREADARRGTPDYDEVTDTDDAPVVPAREVAAFLAWHRPPDCRAVDLLVPPHEEIGQSRHSAVLRTVLAELLDCWPAGSTFVVDYGQEYAQGVAYSPALLTEIGPVTEEQVHRAVELGWMNPAHTPRDHPDFESSPLWIGNPVREWTYPIDTIPQIAQFIAISVVQVYGIDPASGYTVKIFHNHSTDDADPPDPEPASSDAEAPATVQDADFPM